LAGTERRETASPYGKPLLRIRETRLVFYGPGRIFHAMKRPVFSRTVTALWGVWFIAVLLGPATLHACPQHAAASHAGHAGMLAESHHAAPEKPAQHQGVEHKCNCLSECCAVAMVAPSTATLASAKVQVVRDEPACSSECTQSPARHEHAQPFSNGPPSRV
jgi:hypothetical protein